MWNSDLENSVNTSMDKYLDLWYNINKSEFNEEIYMNKKKDIIKKNVECKYTKLHFTKGKPRIVKYEREIKNPVLRFLFCGKLLNPEYIIYLPEDSIDKTFLIDLE